MKSETQKSTLRIWRKERVFLLRFKYKRFCVFLDVKIFQCTIPLFMHSLYNAVYMHLNVRVVFNAILTFYIRFYVQKSYAKTTILSYYNSVIIVAFLLDFPVFCFILWRDGRMWYQMIPPTFFTYEALSKLSVRHIPRASKKTVFNSRSHNCTWKTGSYSCVTTDI